MNTALGFAFWAAMLRVLDSAPSGKIPRIRNFSFPGFFQSQLRILGAGIAMMGAAVVLAAGLPGLRSAESFLWMVLPASWPLVLRRDLSLAEWLLASGLTLGLLPVFPAIGWWGVGSGMVSLLILSIFFEIGLRAILERVIHSPRGKSRTLWGTVLCLAGFLTLVLSGAAAPWTGLRWLEADTLFFHLFGL